MVIYTFRGDYKNRSSDLLKRALAAYEAENNNALAPELYHSISHTGSLWGCLVSTGRVGFDLQETRDLDCYALAERFFLPEEAEFVHKNGLDGFYDIWVRKEACVKYYRTGLMRDIKSFSVVKGGALAASVTHRGGTCFLESFDYCEGVRCACASDRPGPRPVIRELP